MKSFLALLIEFFVIYSIGRLSILISLFIFLQFHWSFAAVYFLWFLFDQKRSTHGGYQTQWVRRLPLAKWFADYFPASSVKTAELPPENNYMLICHPHGIIPLGVWASFAINGTGVFEKFPGITFKLATLKTKLLLSREIWMLHGCIDCSKESLEYVLDRCGRKGLAVVVSTGGAAEALDAYPPMSKSTVKHRKMFIKEALATGAHLVPVYSFGDDDSFENWSVDRRNFMTKVQDNIKAIVSSVTSGNGLGIFPRRRPITTVIGAPIKVTKSYEPTEAEINELHALYRKKVSELFEKHKRDYGIGEEVRINF